LSVRKVRTIQALGGCSAGKRMMVSMSGVDQAETKFIVYPGIFKGHDLRDLRPGRIELFQLFHASGPHSGFVERAGLNPDKTRDLASWIGWQRSYRDLRMQGKTDAET
jgi:hypothetical protein